MLARQHSLVRFDPPTGAGCALPGLVSSVRPIKRISAQLNDELALVHRFSYKNKNQHKASKWWNKVIHVDRTLRRTLDEVESLVAHFDSDKASDEATNVGSAQLVQAILQLPRSLILVEKSLRVLLDCASILEQLIETKAFLAFILVVVSLVARLHSLALVLEAELGNLGKVLLHLVESNHLSGLVEPLIARLPLQLRRHLVAPTRRSSPPPPPPTAASDSSVRAEGGSSTLADDLGAVVVRKSGQRKQDERGADTGDSSNLVEPVSGPYEATIDASHVEGAKLSKKKTTRTATRQEEDSGSPIALGVADHRQGQRSTGDVARAVDSSSLEKKKKKRQAVPGGEEGEAKAVVARVKKKARPRKSLDEIDAIFA
ncbi:hypothetical protein JCM11491_001627 [Sporobolomyces phaffii]